MNLNKKLETLESLSQATQLTMALHSHLLLSRFIVLIVDKSNDSLVLALIIKMVLLNVPSVLLWPWVALYYFMLQYIGQPKLTHLSGH